MDDTGPKSDTAKKEEEILAFWKRERIFEKSLEKPAPKGEFVFYDGPPFATGLPHSGSLLSSVSKDVIPRYKTMRGYFVRRRWGWDTHGLPIESLVEKKLGLKNKKEILSIGIEKFNEEARSMVLEYVHDWKRYVERVGRWVDFDNSYKTMDPGFMESVWWALKQIHEKGRLYEGRKVLMYCPHCETPLAKAEIAMDNTYKDVNEEAVTVRFDVTDPEKHGLPAKTSLLAWTTTPWTLPGNVALAVNPEMKYGVYDKDGEHLIAATDRAEALGLAHHVEIRPGSSLVGISYEPLYRIAGVEAHAGKKWEVVPADFVTADEGTGIVHTAVMYGEDDYQLGVREGLPMVPILNPNGTYNDMAPEFVQGQYIKKAEAPIKADLEERGLMFAKAMNTHSYPHCYRCGTALIYNAVSSWFIDIQAIKERMLAENETITWAPEHLKYGRFKHIVDNAPDWTISRNRFWASPLPIWKGEDGSVHVVGSVEELKAMTKKSGNTYYTMRHGEAENNALDELDCTDEKKWPLTEKGKEQARAAAEGLKAAGITKIIASPFERTRETAAILTEALGLGEGRVTYDPRLHELNVGELSGASRDVFFKTRDAMTFDEKFPGGESYQDAKNRFGEFLYELEGKEHGETILIVTHGVGIESFRTIVTGADRVRSKELASAKPGLAEPVKVDFVPLPHNRNYELDLHLPYIDEVEVVDADGKPLTRIPEVVDCWVESGSMPFAEYHYPFENKEEFEKRSPGDFISEYIGQTRAWFYYLHAIGVSIFDRAAFKNVITTGNVNAADGAKLSKSKRNYTDPYLLFDKYGADAFRYYLMSSVVMQAEDLTFKDDDIKEAQNRVVNMIRNVASFYGMYAGSEETGESDHVLDRWIRARLGETRATVTDAFDRYDVIRATRPLRAYVEDLSQWYLRRSRDRMKTEGAAQDRAQALGTLRAVLKELAQLCAPVMPFVAEELYRQVRRDGDPESVHLSVWPEGTGTAVDAALIEGMVRARAVASEALMLRQKANVKVRQPLAMLSVPGELPADLAELVADEVNVKEVRLGADALALDLDLTPELIREGDLRDFMRAVNDARKERALAPQDRVALTVSENAQALFTGADLPGISSISFGAPDAHAADLSFGKVTFAIDAA